MKKRILALVLSLTMVSSMIVGCGGTEGEKTEPQTKVEEGNESSDGEFSSTDVAYWDSLPEDAEITWKSANEKTNKVCLVIPDSTQEFYNEIATTVEGIMKENGYEFEYIGLNGDATNAIAAIETWTASGTDAIIIMAQDNTCDDALKAAMEQGVLVVSASAEIAHYHHWLLQNNYDVGYQTAQMAADWLNENYPGGKEKYIVLRNDMTEATADKGEGCQKGMEELYPDGTCAGVVAFSGNMDQVMNDVETLVSQNKDIKAIVAMHNSLALLGYQAAATVGIAEKGNIGVFGSALSEQVKDMLKAGNTSYEGEIWMGDQGRQMAENTLALLNGETLTRWYYAKNYPITSENIDTYYEEYYAE